METNAPVLAGPQSEGFLHGLAFFLSGLVLPLGSLTFYRKASQRRVAVAILFFLLLTCGITVFVTIKGAASLWSFQNDIQKSFDEGKFPEITIQDGIAQVKGAQTRVLMDDPQMFVAIDTTGQYTGIDRSKYQQGFLLTRDTLYFLSQNGQYRSIPLSEVNTAFNQNPIVINAQTSIYYWQIFSVIFAVFLFLILILWNTVVRLMYVAMLALLVWGVASLIRPNVGFGPIIITALYALVPAIYISDLFDLAKVSFPGLQTLLFIPFWAAGLFAYFSSTDFFRDKPLRLWRALIGVPLLLVLLIDIFITNYPYEAGIAWGVAVLTMLGLAAAALFTRLNRPGPLEAAPIAPIAPAPPQV